MFTTTCIILYDLRVYENKLMPFWLLVHLAPYIGHKYSDTEMPFAQPLTTLLNYPKDVVLI